MSFKLLGGLGQSPDSQLRVQLTDGEASPQGTIFYVRLLLPGQQNDLALGQKRSYILVVNEELYIAHKYDSSVSTKCRMFLRIYLLSNRRLAMSNLTSQISSAEN